MFVDQSLHLPQSLAGIWISPLAIHEPGPFLPPTHSRPLLKLWRGLSVSFLLPQPGRPRRCLDPPSASRNCSVTTAPRRWSAPSACWLIFTTSCRSLALWQNVQEFFCQRLHWHIPSLTGIETVYQLQLVVLGRSVKFCHKK